MVEKQVLKQLNVVRDDGSVNMLQRNGVLLVAYRLALYDLTEWMTAHSSIDYFNMLTGEFSEWLEAGRL